MSTLPAFSPSRSSCCRQNAGAPILAYPQVSRLYGSTNHASSGKEKGTVTGTATSYEVQGILSCPIRSAGRRPWERCWLFLVGESGSVAPVAPMLRPARRAARADE